MSLTKPFEPPVADAPLAFAILRRLHFCYLQLLTSPTSIIPQNRAGAVINKLAPSPSSSILITGLGAVGFGALFAAAHLKLEQIIVVDIVPSRLELAKTLGATHAFNGLDKDVVEQVKAATKYGEGVNYAVECTGNVRVLKTAYDATANRGHVVSCGTPGPGNAVPIE